MRHPAARTPSVPYLEVVAGGVWWIVGAAAWSAGAGTVILAAGLGVTGVLVFALRQRHGSGAPLPYGARTKLLQVVIGAVVLIAITGTLLGLASLGELAVPLACAIAGGSLFPLASLLDERALLAAGAALLVLGAVGALLALDSAGGVGSRGVVGLVAATVLWLAAATRTGLLAEVQGRVRR